MNYYIGIDLGTSALKGVLVAENGKIVKQASAEYGVLYPQHGWVEQNPSDWLVALDKVIMRLISDDNADNIVWRCPQALRMILFQKA